MLIRNHRLRPMLTLVLLFVVSFAGFCDGGGQITVLRSALRAAPALTNSLVVSGVLTQAQADGVVKDFTDGGDAALEMANAIAAVPKDAPDRNTQIARAAHTAADKWRTIVARGHFRVHPRVEQAFSIADGIFLFVEAFYADRAGEATHADIGADGLSEKEFQQALDSRLDELKQSLKP